MITHKERKKYKIEILLSEMSGAKSEFIRSLWLSNTAVNMAFSKWLKTIRTQKKYTEAFNKCFEVNYSYKELFSLAD